MKSLGNWTVGIGFVLVFSGVLFRFIWNFIPLELVLLLRHLFIENADNTYIRVVPFKNGSSIEWLLIVLGLILTATGFYIKSTSKT